MRTPIYIAGASKAWQRAKAMAERLQETGKVEITGRWFDAVAAWGVGNDHALTDEQRIVHASDDLVGVDRAAIVLVLWDEHRSEGRSLELGYVMGKDGVTTVVAGPDTRRSIFTSLVDVCFDLPVEEADERAFDAVLDIIASQEPRTLPDAVTGERP